MFNPSNHYHQIVTNIYIRPLLDSSISLPKRSSSNYPATLFYRNTESSDLTTQVEVAVTGGVIRLMRTTIVAFLLFGPAASLFGGGQAKRAG